MSEGDNNEPYNVPGTEGYSGIQVDQQTGEPYAVFHRLMRHPAGDSLETIEVTKGELTDTINALSGRIESMTNSGDPSLAEKVQNMSYDLDMFRRAENDLVRSERLIDSFKASDAHPKGIVNMNMEGLNDFTARTASSVGEFVDGIRAKVSSLFDGPSQSPGQNM